ncbi:MAG: hypothetical protein ACTSP8_01065 [Promethearchaeota archaeon]
MSSKVSDKKFHKSYLMLELDLSDTIISFKELFGYIGAEYIYYKKEEIPFKEKLIEFQKIMLSEFTT